MSDLKLTRGSTIKLSLILVSMFALIKCNSKVNSKSDASTEVLHDTLKIENRLTTFFNNRECDEFYKLFPDNFNDFQKLYGWNEKTDEAQVLYGTYEQHISFLFNCVKSKEEHKKLFSICIGGKWEADGIGFFQDEILQIFSRDASGTTNLLKSNFSSIEIASIWYFLFDGPHPGDQSNKSKFNLIYESIKQEFSQESKLLYQQYQKLLNEDEHGH